MGVACHLGGYSRGGGGGRCTRTTRYPPILPPPLPLEDAQQGRRKRPNKPQPPPCEVGHCTHAVSPSDCTCTTLPHPRHLPYYPTSLPHTYPVPSHTPHHTTFTYYHLLFPVHTPCTHTHHHTYTRTTPTFTCLHFCDAFPWVSVPPPRHCAPHLPHCLCLPPARGPPSHLAWDGWKGTFLNRHCCFLALPAPSSILGWHSVHWVRLPPGRETNIQNAVPAARHSRGLACSTGRSRCNAPAVWRVTLPSQATLHLLATARSTAHPSPTMRYTAPLHARTRWVWLPPTTDKRGVSGRLTVSISDPLPPG